MTNETETMARILGDLDRCEHGRHEGDVCSGESGCNGPSKGNPCAKPALVTDLWVDDTAMRLARRFDGLTALPPRLIGFNISGKPIVVPDRAHMHDPSAWEAEGR